MDTIGVPTDPSNHIINGTGPLTKMLEMGTEPIDVIGGWADLIVTQRAMGRFFCSVSRCTQTTRQDSRFMTRDVLRRLRDRFDERRGNNETRLLCHLRIIARTFESILETQHSPMRAKIVCKTSAPQRGTRRIPRPQGPSDPTRIIKPTEEFGQGGTQRLDQRGVVTPGDIMVF